MLGGGGGGWTTPISSAFVCHPSANIRSASVGLHERCHVFSRNGRHSFPVPPPPTPKPFTESKRLISPNAGGVVSAEFRSTRLDIKQTGDYWDDIRCASGLFPHVSGI